MGSLIIGRDGAGPLTAVARVSRAKGSTATANDGRGQRRRRGPLSAIASCRRTSPVPTRVNPPRFLRRWRRRRCRHRWWRMVHPARVCHAFRPSIRTWRSWTRWDHAAVMRAASTRPDGRCTVTDRSAMHGEARWAQTAKPDLQHLPIRVCAPASRARRGLSPRSAHRQGRISLPSGSRSWRKVQRTSMAAQAATPSPGFTFLLFDPLTSRADQEGANWRAASRKR
jgi:hypothetical protein